MKILSKIRQLFTPDPSDLPVYGDLPPSWIDEDTLPAADGEAPPEFVPFGKLQRLYNSRHGVVITEKVDGTNGAIHVRNGVVVAVQSRKRLITPENDNFGFARWVFDNADLIAEILGDGLHFGEWISGKIQRGYGLQEPQFRLFNVSRFKGLPRPDFPQLQIVPVLFSGSIEERGLDQVVKDAVAYLDEHGSQINPGFMNYEGVVVHFPDSQTSFKHVVNAPGSKKQTRG